MSLEAQPVRLFSSDFAVRDEGRPITTIDLALLRSRGHFTLDGVEYGIRPRGLSYGVFSLERGPKEVARAERESLLPLRYAIRATDRWIRLEGRPLARRFTVLHGDRAIGTIRPRHLLSRAAVFQGGDDLPLPYRVFMLAVVLLRWRRRGRAASGGG